MIKSEKQGSTGAGKVIHKPLYWFGYWLFLLILLAIPLILVAEDGPNLVGLEVTKVENGTIPVGTGLERKASGLVYIRDFASYGECWNGRALEY